MSGFKLWWIKGAFAVLLLLIPGNFGWGEEGHYITCKIAESFLTKEALKAVKELLPETDLASVCSWPDEIKQQQNWQWTSELHYVNTPDLKCNYDYCRDCHDSSRVKDNCVTGAIYNYTEQLITGYNASDSVVKYNLTEALIFLSHYIGDVHQVWDTLIIQSAMNDFYSRDIDVMTSAIKKNIDDTWSNDISYWKNCTSGDEVCPDPWASESINFSCNYAYQDATPGTDLGDEYFDSRLPVVEKRLAQGGVRLVETLNRIFDPYPSISHKLAYFGSFQPTCQAAST